MKPSLAGRTSPGRPGSNLGNPGALARQGMPAGQHRFLAPMLFCHLLRSRTATVLRPKKQLGTATLTGTDSQ